MKKIYIFILFYFSFLNYGFSQTFTNVASQIGINSTYNDRFYYIPGGGAGFADYDNDGDPDMIVASSTNFKVYKNNNGTFAEVTSSSGINFSGDALKSVVWGDFNNDGWRDVYLTSWYSGNRLYKNNGNGSFSDVTSTAGVGVPFNYQSSTAAWGDINKDGFIDLYVGNYGNIEGQGNQFNILYKNNGNGTFSDITNSAGVLDSLGKKPLVIVMFDFNMDGWQDIYIANDKQQRSTLYKNNGNLTFADISYSSGTMCFADAMGLTVADINHDGWLDLYVTADVSAGPPGGNYLFRKNSNETFTNIAASSGTRVMKECWGANFFDYNNDGWADLFVAASSGIDMCDVLLKNNGNSTFASLGHTIGIVDSAKSHGSAVCDYNLDGYPDLFVVMSDSNVRAYRNSGGSNNWMKIKCTGVQSNKDAIGTIVTAYYGSVINRQTILAGNSYLSSDDVVLMFGLGSAAQVDSVNFRWTNGLNETVGTLQANHLYYALEGSGIIGITNVSSEIPAEYELKQNYPNPFNPKTVIGFSLPSAENITLKIYDISGREISTLVNQRLNAGKYSVDFDASSISSGVYFYVLRAPGAVISKKMILTK